ncbi:HlyD family type I secretion periplasmic adaptor subunit [Leptolyngbya sp. FACHB-36]|uniref:HlyD family type I secretion periplasmic adaptor subunit n=1 Tax=Leptolyngbya sp. FACHB-36 TaxID=2692808 RepID=UPI0016809E10|nr:HlyD family type I secretion periplasmic adaptor subunit [Leptolyngbya sp. FACHB-36]MBD2020532.1 HlyD family type I secretion periplasmic adaptor subunit [Leptolyngbya sp. FACHB-36]
MRVSISSNPAQSRQVKQRLANPEDSLSYELGKAVQELPPLYTRLLAGSITLLVFSAIGWAYFSKVDEVAVANGKLIPSTEVRPIRSLSVGSVLQTKVKVGAPVKKDDVLVEIDPGVSETSVTSLEKDAEKIREDIARLEAESKGETSAGTPLQNQLLAARQQEFTEKQAAASAEANRQGATIEEARVRLERFQENLINAQTSLRNTKDNLKNAEKREASLRTLVESNAVPRLDYLNALDQLTNAKNQVTDAEDKIVSLEKEIDAQRDRIRQSQQAFESARSTAQGVSPSYQREVLTQLSQRREELTKKSGELAIAQKQQKERETVSAPFDGTVYNVKVTQGPVQQGEELLSILPKNQDLVLEVKVLNRDIGFIREGMRAKVKLATFPYQEFGIVDGEVLQVSPDAVVERDETGRELGPVFLTRVRLNKDTINVRGKDVKLTPGMAATAEIVTRQKSVLTFLIEPVTRRFSEAFSVR